MFPTLLSLTALSTVLVDCLRQPTLLRSAPAHRPLLTLYRAVLSDFILPISFTRLDFHFYRRPSELFEHLKQGGVLVEWFNTTPSFNNRGPGEHDVKDG